MCVHGLEIQVIADLAVLQMKTLKDGSPWSHMAKMLSICLHQTRGILSWVSRNSRPSFPMNRLAYDGAIRVRITVPWTCK